jgi:predicted transcriptional regulator
MAKRKKEFMEWLDGEIERHGREREVAALMDEMLVEEQLAALRRKRGMSQARLAQLMGVQQPLIARMESGRVKNLTLSTIARMATTLGARVELRIVPSRMKRQKATAQRA